MGHADGESSLYEIICEITREWESGNIRFLDAYWHIGNVLFEAAEKYGIENIHCNSFFELLSNQLSVNFGQRYTNSELKYMWELRVQNPDIELLNHDLTWQHHRWLSLQKDPRRREFYEAETAYNGWSSATLANQIRANLFEGIAPPPIRWRIGALQPRIMELDRGLLIADVIDSIEDSDPGPENERPREPVSRVRVTAFHEEKCDEPVILGDFTAQGEPNFGYGWNGTYWVGCGNRLYCRSPEGPWEICADGGSFRLIAPPMQLSDGLYGLWCDDWDDFRLKVSKTISSQTAFGPVTFDCGGLADWDSWEGELYVRTHGSVSSKVYHLDRDSLELVALGVLGAGKGLLITDGFLFCADGRSLKTEGDKDPGGFRELRELGYQVSINLRSTFIDSVAVYELPGLDLLKRWQVSDRICAIEYVPRLRSLLATQNTWNSTLTEMIHPEEPSVVTVAKWNGSLAAKPLVMSSKILWLIHKGKSRYLPEKWYRKPENFSLEFCTEYAVEIFNLPNNSWRSLSINLGEPICAVTSLGTDVVFMTLSGLIAMSAEDVWDAARSTSLSGLRVLESGLEFKEAFLGSTALRGPRVDNFGHLIATNTFRDLVALSPLWEEGFEIPADESSQIEIHNSLTAWAQNEVLDGWPDFWDSLARECPGEFLELLEAEGGEMPEAVPFGALNMTNETARRFTEWLANRLSGFQLPEDPKVAGLIARFLLGSYIRRCQTQKPVDDAAETWRKTQGYLDFPEQGKFREAYAWMNLRLVRPAGFEWVYGDAYWNVMKSAAMLTIVSAIVGVAGFVGIGSNELAAIGVRYGLWGTLAFGAMAAGLWLGCGRAIRIRENHVTREEVLQLSAKWAGGSPSPIRDTDRYLDFVDDIASSSLLTPIGRDSLQTALMRAWKHPVVKDGCGAFISYSHADADLAKRIAAGLRGNGIRISLDTFELRLDSDEWAIETWIAENIMRADSLILIMSQEFAQSAWVAREAEWSQRLLGVKPCAVLPYLLLTTCPAQANHYPPGRVIDLRGVDTESDWLPIIDELAIRIALDAVLSLRAVRDGVFFTPHIPTDVSEESVIEIVAVPEFPA